MGMAVMLDEIINYVQSLQSQVEVSTTFLFFSHKFHSLYEQYILIHEFEWFSIQFLSMKLTAASNFYNFNAETDTMDFMQVLIHHNYEGEKKPQKFISACMVFFFSLVIKFLKFISFLSIFYFSGEAESKSI